MLRTNKELIEVMKTNTNKKLASTATLVILVPVFTLAMSVSVKSSGVVENDVLLLLLTLSGAVLSGINGFGRRTAKASSVSPSRMKSTGRSVHGLS
jgi:positive regulator of sigma E activity